MPHNGHLYVHDDYSFSGTWDEADAAAKALTCCGAQGHLVIINDAAERDFVKNTLVRAGSYGWIGLKDEVVEGTYVWTDGTSLDTSLFTVASFNPGQADAEDCGSLYRTTWITLQCESSTNYMIVEFDCPST
jgi:Lectin C-type domain